MMYKVLALAALSATAVTATPGAACGNNVGVGAGGCAATEVCVLATLTATARTCQPIPPVRKDAAGNDVCIPRKPTDTNPPLGCVGGSNRNSWSTTEVTLSATYPSLFKDGDCKYFLGLASSQLWCVRCVQLAGVSTAYPNGVWGEDLTFASASKIQNPGRWCPRGDTCTTDRCLKGICTSNLNCAYKKNYHTEQGACYCDESCLSNSPPDCCPDYETNCVEPIVEKEEPGLCGHVSRGLREFCPDNVGDVFRPAWAIRFSRVGGCSDPTPDTGNSRTNGQPDNNRCILGSQIGMDRDYFEFACAGVSQDIVTRRCRRKDCTSGCDEDWSVFMNGNVQAGKCFSTGANDSGDHWMFVCDPLDFFEFPGN